MSKTDRDAERENRISMEIVVDAYDREERMMGWYYYLDETLQFPFAATCLKKRSISPVRLDAEVNVVGMADFDECANEMFVEIEWEEDDRLAIPLAQISAMDNVDEDTQQAVTDWLYWVDRGYQFG